MTAAGEAVPAAARVVDIAGLSPVFETRDGPVHALDEGGPNGAGGLEDPLSVPWSEGVFTGRLTREEFVAVGSANVARILNIYPRKGAVAVGSDADLVVIDPAATKSIAAAGQTSRIEYNVFEGKPCHGAPVATIAGGALAWTPGVLRAYAGGGASIKRPAFPAAHIANMTWRSFNAARGVARTEVTP